ncbi:hypothetical protein I350_03208 [Cryptococcus amylolentus CBS 6273]|uniref:Protein kinase domain-containing protein n=1 Tax=Cryptococcus amylolentus CBS 6273 TaxID=1296118 RepID=A0A1E3K8Z2_9TREE|nr:hypothetical protein I350_03208 [Cryptococcus amylolentus CBS 6273]
MNQQTPLSSFLPSYDPPLYLISTIPPACIPTSMCNALERITFGPRHFYHKEREAEATDLSQVDQPASLDMGGPADRTTDEHEVTSDPLTTRKRPAEAGPSTSRTSPSKRLKVKKSSPQKKKLHASAKRTDSSSQRKPDSDTALRFWQILKHFTTDVVPRLVRGLRTVVNRLDTLSRENESLALDESLALYDLVHFLFQLENRHSVFTPQTLTRFKEGDPSFGFDTYERRDKKEGSDFVRLVGYGGKEEGSTASAFSGECQAANIYAKHLSRLAADYLSTSSQLESRIYQYAPPVYQVTNSTKLGIERKFDITLRDLFVLFYVLLRNDIELKVNPSSGKPSVDVLEEGDAELSAAVIAILAQLAQEFHVNKCECINLAVHDFSVTFQLMGRNVAHVSRIVFRDPATAARDIRSESELTNILSGIRSETQRTEAVEMLLEHEPWEMEAKNSLFAVLVARSGFAGWQAHYVNSGSTATGGTAFKMFPCPAVAADLHRLQGIDTTHHQSMHRLPYFRWVEDPTFRVQVSPPLTTDKSGAPPSSPIGPTSSMTAASAGFVVSTTEDKEPIRQEPEDLDDLRCKTDHQTVLSLLSRPDLLVELHEYLGSGRLWDAYRVKLSSGSTPSQVVVAKICNLYTFTLGDAYEYETPSAAADAIEIELDLLTHLQAVQGEIVPRLYGRWTGRCQLPSGGTVRLDCVMLEDCGRAIVPSDELETWLYDGDEVERFPTNLSSDVRQQIIESYEKLHKQGILHVDVNARHILLHPVDKKPRIIDFEGAISISEAQATNQDYDAEQEMERVRWLVRADEER